VEVPRPQGCTSTWDYKTFKIGFTFVIKKAPFWKKSSELPIGESWAKGGTMIPAFRYRNIKTGHTELQKVAPGRAGPRAEGGSSVESITRRFPRESPKEKDRSGLPGRNRGPSCRAQPWRGSGARKGMPEESRGNNVAKKKTAQKNPAPTGNGNGTLFPGETRRKSGHARGDS